MTQPIDSASVAIIPDFSGFEREAEQGVEESLRDVARTAQQAFGQVERSATKAARDARGRFVAAGAAAEQAIREVGQQSQIMAAQVSASSAAAGASLGSRISAGALAAKAGVAALALAVAAGLGAITTFGLRSAAALEQTQIGIEALVGSAEQATAFIGELQQFAATTPFEFAGIADASRRILAFGGAVGIAREEVIPTLTTIGDLVSVLGGTQEHIDSVIRAFGQISSKGKVSQEELLQLAEALPGFSANAAIASATGQTVAESMEAITRGEVDATTGINALLAGMAAFPGAAGAMEKQSQTLLGVFSTFKDTISIALTSAFQPVIPALKESLTAITPILGEAIGQLAPLLGKLLSTALPLVANLVSALVPILNPIIDALTLAVAALAPALQPLGDALGRIVTAVAPLLPVLGQLVAELVIALVPAIDALLPHLDSLVPAIGDLLIALVPILPPLGELLALFIQSQVPLTQLIALFAQLLTSKAIVPLIEGLAGALQFLADTARPVIEFSDSVGEIGTNLSTLGETVGGVVSTITTWLSELPGKALAALKALPGRLLQLLTGAFNQAAFAVGFGIGRIIQFVTELPSRALAALTSLPGRLREFFNTAVETVRTTVVTKFNQIVDFAKGLPQKVVDALRSLIGRITGFASEIGPKAIQLGKDIVNGIISGIKSTISGVGSALKSGLDSAVRGVKAGLGISSPSKVLADEVGRWLPPGIELGIQQGMPALAASLTGLVGDITAITGRGAPSSSLTVDVGGVVVNGSATAADATTIGATVGRSVASAARRTQVALAVRSR